MLKPKDFNYKADKVTQYYNEFEDSLLRDIAKFLLGADGLGGKAERELFILEQMGMNKDEITKRLATLTAQSESAVKEVLEQSVMTSFSNDKQVLDKYFNGDFGPLDNPAIKQTMDAEWVKTCGELENLTKTTMGAYNSTVVSALDDAEVLCASGAVSYSEAVTRVLDNIAATGLLLDYPTGTRRSLEAAVRCAVVTSMNQTAAQVTNQYIAEGGIEYVLVSAHTGARISDKGGLYSHAEWQGRAYKIRGSEEGFPNLLEATGYDIDPSTGNGTVVNPAGLHGYNCRHSHQPWDKDLDNPWVDSKGNLKVDAEEKKYIEDKQSAIDERIARIQANELYSDKQKERLIVAEEKRRTTSKYEDMQTQRRMESQIRDTKRQMVMKDAELDNVKHDTNLFVQLMGERKNLEHKLTNRNRVYGQYCADFGLTQQRDRLKVAGYTNKRNIGAGVEKTTIKTKKLPNFIPADNMQAAEMFAQLMVDNEQWAALGVRYQGLGVDVANEINETLADFMSMFDVEKFGGVYVPQMNTSLGKSIKNDKMAYNPARNSILINPTNLKSKKMAETYFREEAEIVSAYLKNPAEYKIESDYTRKILNNSITSGRATVPMNVKECLWHELGHSLESRLKVVENFDIIKANKVLFDSKISGYATASMSEYLAESFTCYMKGENIIDPELVKAFDLLKR